MTHVMDPDAPTQVEPLPAGEGISSTLRIVINGDPEGLQQTRDAWEQWRVSASEQRARSILGSAYQWPHRRGRRHG